MDIAKLIRQCVHALVAIGSLTAPAIAQTEPTGPPKASLLNLTLTPGGSVNPPGDRLDAAILLYPGTDRVDLDLGAEAIDPTPQGANPAKGEKPVLGDDPADVPQTPRPLLAKDAAHRGPDGRFLVTASAIRKKGAVAIVSVVLIAPSSAVDLTPTGRLIRYTLHGNVGGIDAFSTITRTIDPSKLSQVSETRRPSTNPNVMPAQPVDATSAPQAPSKTLPKAQAPAAPGKTMPAGGGPQAPAETFPGAPNTASSLIPEGQPFAVLKKRPVLYATNRTIESSMGTPSERFGNTVDTQIHYGSCLVNLPVDKNHTQGKLEEPTWLSRDPDRFFMIDATNVLSFEDFEKLIVPPGADTRRDILLYIHGFNTPFDFAVMRLAQVTHDIRFSGVSAVFSWPSHGSPFRYSADETNAMKSTRALADTFETLIALQAARPNVARGKIHIIAHSLGNRVTLGAIEILRGGLAAGHKPFGQIILAAPDVAVADFSRLLPAAQEIADRVSLYFCRDDIALAASRFYHSAEPRAGVDVVPIKFLDNIDARKANTSFLGHGYWADVKQLLIDLQMLVNLGLSPEKRIYTLEPVNDLPAYPYWALR